MKARVTIIGNLTKDAENFVVQKSGKEYCKFTVAVNYQKDKSVFFVDCILNVPLSEERLKLYIFKLKFTNVRREFAFKIV